jgi:hypothetical protein
MKNYILLLLLLLLAVEVFPAGKTKYWIFFKDKGEIEVKYKSLSKNGDIYSLANKYLSEKSIQRRIIRLGKTSLDYSDLPVNEEYINELKKIGIKIENVSRWFNAVTAYLNEEELNEIKKFKFVDKTSEVVVFKCKDKSYNDERNSDIILQKSSSKYNYGLSLFQNQTINVPKVHDLGIEGNGVLVGLMDTGFDWKRHSSLMNLKVLREYDFIFRDSITANESVDVAGQDSHGTLCFSILAGFAPDTLIGPSFKSEFILAKTEDTRSETKIEEDNWVSAAEWMESLGVDVVSSSLGYNEFDNNIGNYTYKDMDGNTAIITKAADIAVSKGIVVVISAGNEGSTSWKYITAPADGKNVISVGAVSSNGSKASFSSIGPTYDGRIKPDVCALGVSVYHAVSGGKNFYSYSSGTSVACPLVAGVASLILSSRPDLTPFQVRDALRNTASNNSSPNNEIGWGIIDAYKALTYYGVVFSNEPKIENFSDKVKVSSYIASSYPIDQNSIKLYYSTDGKSYTSISMNQETKIDDTNSGLYSATIPKQSGTTIFYYYFSATDTKGTRKHPFNAPDKNFILNNNEIVTLPNNYILYQNYPNPFNSTTQIKFSVPNKSKVTLKIYNILGQNVKTLIDRVLEPNQYTVNWNGRDENKNICGSGLYFYCLEGEGFKEIKKMVLIK